MDVTSYPSYAGADRYGLTGQSDYVDKGTWIYTREEMEVIHTVTHNREF